MPMSTFIGLHDTLGHPVIVNIQDIQYVSSCYDRENNISKGAAIKFLHNTNCLFTNETVDEIADIINKGLPRFKYSDVPNQ